MTVINRFFCGCDTWLNSNTLNSEVLPPSYKLYLNNRADGYSGVLIGIKSNIISDLVDISPHFEVCTVLLHLLKSSNLFLFCVHSYRSPNTDVTYQASL